MFCCAHNSLYQETYWWGHGICTREEEVSICLSTQEASNCSYASNFTQASGHSYAVLVSWSLYFNSCWVESFFYCLPFWFMFFWSHIDCERELNFYLAYIFGMDWINWIVLSMNRNVGFYFWKFDYEIECKTLFQNRILSVKPQSKLSCAPSNQIPLLKPYPSTIWTIQFIKKKYLQRKPYSPTIVAISFSRSPLPIRQEPNTSHDLLLLWCLRRLFSRRHIRSARNLRNQSHPHPRLRSWAPASTCPRPLLRSLSRLVVLPE